MSTAQKQESVEEIQKRIAELEREYLAAAKVVDELRFKLCDATETAHKALQNLYNLKQSFLSDVTKYLSNQNKEQAEKIRELERQLLASKVVAEIRAVENTQPAKLEVIEEEPRQNNVE